MATRSVKTLDPYLKSLLPALRKRGLRMSAAGSDHAQSHESGKAVDVTFGMTSGHPEGARNAAVTAAIDAIKKSTVTPPHQVLIYDEPGHLHISVFSHDVYGENHSKTKYDYDITIKVLLLNGHTMLVRLESLRRASESVYWRVAQGILGVDDSYQNNVESHNQ